MTPPTLTFVDRWILLLLFGWLPCVEMGPIELVKVQSEMELEFVKRLNGVALPQRFSVGGCLPLDG